MTVDEAWAALAGGRDLLIGEDAARLRAAEQGFRAGWEAARPKWRPMAEAPRDGRTVVGRREAGQLYFVRWDEDLGEWLDEGSDPERLLVEWTEIPS